MKSTMAEVLHKALEKSKSRAQYDGETNGHRVKISVKSAMRNGLPKALEKLNFVCAAR